MSRVKHLSMLIVKLALFVLVFGVTAAMLAMQSYPTDGISFAQNLNENNVDVWLENGATLEYEVVDGEIVFDITQSGEDYDDIVFLLTFEDVKYDSTFIRSLFGEDAGKNEAFISAMENGPWLGHYSFALKGESYLTTTKGYYTFSGTALDDYVESVLSSGANTLEQTESFTVEKEDDSLTVMLIFGTKENGALASGKYTLDAELKLGHPEGERMALGYFDVAGVLFRVAGRALSSTGVEVLDLTFFLTLYCVWVILGWFIYLWRDMRTVIGAFMSGSLPESMITVKDVYVNGVYSGSMTESDAGANLMMRIICAFTVWILLTVTIPLRMLWYLIRDIIYLFKEDEVLEDFSYTGNLLGSIGIHVIIFGLAGVFGVERIVGIIALIVGVGMCIGAHFVCKSREY